MKVLRNKGHICVRDYTRTNVVQNGKKRGFDTILEREKTMMSHKKMINNHTFIRAAKRHENVKLQCECGWKYLLFHNRTTELLQLNTACQKSSFCFIQGILIRETSLKQCFVCLNDTKWLQLPICKTLKLKWNVYPKRKIPLLFACMTFLLLRNTKEDLFFSLMMKVNGVQSCF